MYIFSLLMIIFLSYNRVHFDTPETDMALKVSDEGHDYAVLQRNTCGKCTSAGWG